MAGHAMRLEWSSRPSLRSLLCQVKEFGSYLEDNGMPLKSFKGGSIRY